MERKSRLYTISTHFMSLQIAVKGIQLQNAFITEPKDSGTQIHS